ncbi:hypothetical protein NDU88_005571 [Pleurodeles waltl]|uniref:Uncharacterized protein n=1 Tax=Pleurodeles waltl TaxID=8319 RepID=A0AAV7WV47_PLEWA|nr:hypothetical protein NDU88_005571 [Pleurodeles waltl]
MADDCVEEGRSMDLGKLEALGPLRLARKASQGVAAAVIVCSPLRTLSKVAQVRKGGRVPGLAMGRGRGGWRPAVYGGLGARQGKHACLLGTRQREECGQRPGGGPGRSLSLNAEQKAEEKGEGLKYPGKAASVTRPPNGIRRLSEEAESWREQRPERCWGGGKGFQQKRGAEGISGEPGTSGCHGG